MPEPTNPPHSVTEGAATIVLPPSLPPSGSVVTGEEDDDKPKPRTLARWIGKLVRPVAKAAEEAVTTVVDVGAESRQLFHRVTRLPASPDFQLWYENLKGPERHGLQFGKWAERAFGEKPEGIAGIAETFVQFGLGFFGATRILKAPSVIGKVTGSVRVAGTATKAGKSLIAGASQLEKAGVVADFAFMDEYENNFFGLVDKSPESVQNALTRALAADEDDPATWNRLRNGLQGFVVGRALEKTIGMVRSLWLWRKAKKLPVGNPERGSLENKIKEIAEQVDTPVAASPTGATPVNPQTAKEAVSGSVSKEASKEAAESSTSSALDVLQAEDGSFRFSRNGKEVADGPVFQTAGEAHAAAASVNDFVALPTEELTATTRAIQSRITSGANPEDVAGLIDGTVFNFHWVSSPENARAWINAVAEVAPGAHETARQSMEETARIAHELFGGQSPQEALQIARDMLGAVEDLPAKVWGLRAYQHSTAKYVAELSERIDLGGATGLDADKLRVALGTLFELNPAVKRIGTRTGQTLNVFKGATDVPGIQHVEPADAAKAIPLISGEGVEKAFGPNAPASAGIFANMSKRQIQGLARNIRLTGGDPTVVDHFVRNVLAVVPPKEGTTAWGAFQAVRYNSLLSGPLTHARNVFSNFAKYLMHNAELATEGLTTGSREMFQEGVDQLSSLWLDSLESMRLAMLAVKKGTGAILDAGPAQKEGLTDLASLADGSAFAAPKRWLSRLWKAPQTVLMAEDEFFKQLNYRGSVRAQALRDARNLGLPPEKWAQHVRQTLDGAFTPSGAGINTTALELARENTFTAPLQGLLKEGSDLVGKSKFLSFFFPFRATPANIFLQTAERTPGLWRLSTRMRSELAGEFGAERAAQAMARLEMGQNLWLFATGLAAAGHVSGGGPQDKEARRQLLATGWKPYSFKLPGTETWVGFQALEPFSTIFGIAADATESVQDLSREARRRDFEELVGAFVMGVAENVTNKSFLTGMQDMTNIFSGRTSAGERVVSSLAGQLVPFRGFFTQTNPDDVVRDVQSVRDRVLSGIPYFSEGIEPVRSILGLPLKKQSWAERAFWPFAVSDEGSTGEQLLMRDVIQGIGENVRIPMPATTLYRGLVNLRDRDTWKRSDGKNQSPYDRMLELFGTGVGTLPPMKDALRAVVDEDTAKLARFFSFHAYKFGYWKSAKPVDGVDITESDTRLGILRGVLSVYREAAFKQVLKEYPALEAKNRELGGEKRERRLDQMIDQMKSFRRFTGPATP